MTDKNRFFDASKIATLGQQGLEASDRPSEEESAASTTSPDEDSISLPQDHPCVQLRANGAMTPMIVIEPEDGIAHMLPYFNMQAELKRRSKLELNFGGRAITLIGRNLDQLLMPLQFHRVIKLSAKPDNPDVSEKCCWVEQITF